MSDWFLTEDERGNPHTRLLPWTDGNAVRPLVDGRAYYAELLPAVNRMVRGDLLLFTDWRGDPDERLGAGDETISRVLCAAAERGVVVKGLVWRSHWDRLQFSEEENQHLGDAIEAAGGECLRDMRVRAGGSHHQKFVVLRHPGRPSLDVAYVGGIDLCHGRGDDSQHSGDPQAVAIAPVYGDRAPWHDVQLELRGPVVGQVEATFRERWEDPAPLSRNPFFVLHDKLFHEDTHADPLPAQLPDPAPAGDLSVQLLRTYPYRRRGYPFAPEGERTVARGYRKAVARAEQLIYLEDQYLWSPQVAGCFADALREHPGLHLVAVVPRYPDQPGALGRFPQLYGRERALSMLHNAGGDRLHVFSPENADGTPIYVHAKVCVVDDTWATVGSDNVSLRSWTHDSELTCAVLDPTGAYARDLRLRLAREHLGHDDVPDDPLAAVEEFESSARALEAWHAAGRRGPRPPGRLRPYESPHLSAWTSRWSSLVYRTVHDPDGRPRTMRRAGSF
ncbi:phospholipase D family protein [Dactylosporangium sucinum]|uniref:Phospholipase D n=1 Tax=Dactylosporangium sucinum TaxID=1424081 RepID=A0A917WPQ7_9ACTN|nr:phospholipase D family protein [Dactylosporangium sucinum]GGM19337.1 phospholipase D [Dactylosporangium sucinum]